MERMLILLLVLCNLAIYVVGRTLNADDIKTKRPYKVYRIYPNSTDQLNFLKDIWKSASRYQVRNWSIKKNSYLQTFREQFQINFWKDPSNVGTAVDLMVPGHMQAKLENLFETRQMGYLVIIQDVKK